MENEKPVTSQARRRTKNAVNWQRLFDQALMAKEQPRRTQSRGKTPPSSSHGKTCVLPKPLGALPQDQYKVATVSGDSLCDVLIFDGDWVAFRETSHAESGKLIVAETPHGWRVRFYHPSTGGMVTLRAANESHPEEIYLTHEVTIKGVVVSSGRDW